MEALIKKHDDFTKSLDTQEEKFVSLDQFAKTLISRGHYDTLAISTRRDTVLQRSVLQYSFMYVQSQMYNTQCCFLSGFQECVS